MPRITLRETDNTIFNVSSIDSDNIVYVPGSATTGPYDAPVLVGSVSDFTKVFGVNSPSTADDNIGSAWEYAYYLLNQGLPVLFRRVVPLDSSGVVDETKVAKAKVVINSTGETPAEIWRAEEKFGGTFGNTLRIKLEANSNNTAAILKVYRQIVRGNNTYYNLLESIKLVTMAITEGVENTPAYKEALKANFEISGTVGVLETDYIKITVKNLTDFTIAPGFTSDLFTGGTDAPEADVQANIADTYAGLTDKFEYDVKFITAGGYTDAGNSRAIVTAMSSLAEARGDCIFLADIPYATDADDVPTYFSSINTSYGAAYAPWAMFRLTTSIAKWMPPSFIFLHTCSKYISKSDTMWDAPAGVQRGSVPEIVETEYPISGTTLDAWQNFSVQCVNPIMRLRNYGYTIFGQRTLYQVIDGDEDNRASLQELAVRLTANEVKRLIYNTCIRLTFSQNNLATWNEFRSGIEPTLLSMKANGILDDYSVVMDSTTMTDEDVNNNKIKGMVSISVNRAAEEFEIGFELNPSEVSILDQTEITIN